MGTVTMPGIEIETEKEVYKKENVAPTYSIICMNDEIHPFDLVILALMRVKLNMQDAITKTMEIHNSGSAVIKSGLSKDDALIDRHIIVDTTKAGHAFPGIEVQVLEDIQ